MTTTPNTIAKPTPPKPTPQRFDQILENPLIIKNLVEKMGFETATPIQEAVALPIREGRNLFAGAKTGSGKTVAFLAPIAERLFKNEAKYCLVLAPTRELVLQMDEEAMRILDGQTEVVSVPVYGGVPTDPQILAIKHHRPRIFLGTPGRVIDLIQEDCLPIRDIEIAVLDEADRMCDMGFAPQVQQILDLMSARKQTLLFSATLPKELNEIMNMFCPDPVRVQVDAADESSTTIQHLALFCTRHDKMKRLLNIIDHPDATSLVFTRTRNRADEIHRSVSRTMKGVGILHAGFSMPERERTIRDYREGKIKVLIATDVVARGIDVDRITHVVHWDIPDALEDYIHRSGRVGRAGREGETIALVDRESRDQLQKIEEFGKKIQFKMIGTAPSKEELAAGDEGRHSHNRDEGRHSRGGSRGGRGGSSSSSSSSSSSRGRGPRSGSGGRSGPGSSAGGSHRGGRSTPHADGPSKSHSHRPAAKKPHATGSTRHAPAHAHPHATAKVKKPGLLTKTKSLIGRIFKKKPKKTV